MTIYWEKLIKYIRDRSIVIYVITYVKIAAMLNIERWENKNLFKTPGERMFLSAISANLGLLLANFGYGYILRNQETLGIQVFASYGGVYLVLGMHVAFDVACVVGAWKMRCEADRGIENLLFRYPKTG